LYYIINIIIIHYHRAVYDALSISLSICLLLSDFQHQPTAVKIHNSEQRYTTAEWQQQALPTKCQ